MFYLSMYRKSNLYWCIEGYIGYIYLTCTSVCMYVCIHIDCWYKAKKLEVGSTRPRSLHSLYNGIGCSFRAFALLWGRISDR